MVEHGSASQLHPQPRDLNKSNTNSGVSNMIWIKVLIIGSLLCVLEAHKHCMQLIKWENLLQSLMSMSNGVSEKCAPHYNKDSLCDPSQMLNQVELNAVLLAEVMKKAESIYKKHSSSQHFLEALQHTRRVVKPCIHHHHFEHHPVDKCFNKLEAFVKDNMSHVDCAWEIINITVKELLQRMENRTFRRR